MKKIFYSDSLKHEILDESGVLTVEEAKKMRPADDYQVIHLEKNEAFRVVNGVVVKYDFVSERLAEKESQKDARKSLKQSVRTTLNMTKPQFKDFLAGLKAALEDGNDD